MKSDDEASSTKLESKTILFMLVVISLALVWILLPFYGTIMWGGDHCIDFLTFIPLATAEAETKAYLCGAADAIDRPAHRHFPVLE